MSQTITYNTVLYYYLFMLTSYFIFMYIKNTIKMCNLCYLYTCAQACNELRNNILIE